MRLPTSAQEVGRRLEKRERGHAQPTSAATLDKRMCGGGPNGPLPGTLWAMVRMASAMLIISWRSLGSAVASTRNSARLSPTCGAQHGRGRLLCAGGSARHGEDAKVGWRGWSPGERRWVRCASSSFLAADRWQSETWRRCPPPDKRDLITHICRGGADGYACAVWRRRRRVRSPPWPGGQRPCAWTSRGQRGRCA